MGEEEEEGECKRAMQVRTTSSVRARLKGRWQRGSMVKGAGILESSMGRPISSQASRRAIWSGWGLVNKRGTGTEGGRYVQGVSSGVSALPPGRAAWPVWCALV